MTPISSNYEKIEWRLRTELPVDFNIRYINGILDVSNRDLISMGSQGKGARRIIVVDQKVSNFYLSEIVKYFESHTVNYNLVTINATEVNKNIDTLLFILAEFEKFGLNRKSEPVIAIGGGVLLDIVGLAASLYRRGVPYIKVPTTLLGLVDASVGVKTAINFEDRRNRIGTYYPPIVAYLDTYFLKTLEAIEITSGLGEILKMAVVKDAKLFKILKEDGKELLNKKFIKCLSSQEVIYRSITGMKDELQENLWEKNLKRYVDFGHSFSPIPEMRSLSDENVKTLTHGQAVALDVIFSCVLSYVRGFFSRKEVLCVMLVAKNMGLPTDHKYFNDPNILLEALNDTIRHRNGAQNLPIPKTIGESFFINDLVFADIKFAVDKLIEFNNEI